MPYDFNELRRRVEAGAKKHRIPKEQHLFLLSFSFAGTLLENGQAEDLAEHLRRAAEFYYLIGLEQARKPAKAGRSLQMADIGFIFAMATGWEKFFGRPSFRIYQNAKKGQIGGAERPTTFQRYCNAWMKYVDPDRPKPLTSSAFKSAADRYKRIHLTGPTVARKNHRNSD